MTLARLYVLLSLDSGPFRAGMLSAISQIGAMQGRMSALNGAGLSSIGRTLTYGLTVPIIAAAAAIGVFGSKLDAELARVQSVIATPADTGLSQILQWRDGIQDLAITLGRTSPEVAGGMYEIVSALGNIPNAMDYLTIAGRAAVAGQSDIVTSTKNLVLSTRAWGDSSTEAVRKMADLMSATVRVGTVTESELGPAMANLLPIGRLYNVQLEQLFTGIATLAGVSGSASQASTQLQRAIISITSPNTALAAAYKKVGIASGEALLEQKGLLGAFQEIASISERTGVPLNKLVGRVEAVKAIATLTEPQLAKFGENLDAITNSAGAVDSAFEGTTNGINRVAFQWTQAGQRMRVIAEDLYQAFAPVSLKVLDALQPIIGNLRSLADVIGAMPTSQLTTIMYTLLGLAALGPVLSTLGSLVTVFNGLRLASVALGGAMSSLLGPVGLVVLAIGLLWFAWQNNWGNIQERTASATAAIQGHLTPLYNRLGDVGSAFSRFFSSIANGNVSGLVRSVKDLELAFMNLGGQVVLTAIDAVGRFFNIDTSGITNALTELGKLYNAMAEAKSMGESMGILAGSIAKGVEAIKKPTGDIGMGGIWGYYAKDGLPNILPQPKPNTKVNDKLTQVPGMMDWAYQMSDSVHAAEDQFWAGVDQWWAGVKADFGKGYSSAVTQSVKSAPIAPTIGPATFQQVQAGIRTQNFAPAFSQPLTTGLVGGVNNVGWAQVGSTLSTQLKTTAKAPVDSMVSAMQTQLGQALASDKIGGIIKPALETAITQAISTTNFQSISTQFVTAMQQTMNQVRSAITSANLSMAMQSQLRLMVIAMTVTGASMVSAARTITASVRLAFQGSGWSSVGVSISSGIAAGITAGSGAIRAAAAAAAASAITAAKAAIQSSSPSRRSRREVGLTWSQGVALGISDGMSLIQNAATNAWNYMSGSDLTGGGATIPLAGAGGGGIVINIENHFNGPVDEATIRNVESANESSITKALRSRGLV